MSFSFCKLEVCVCLIFSMIVFRNKVTQAPGKKDEQALLVWLCVLHRPESMTEVPPFVIVQQ